MSQRSSVPSRPVVPGAPRIAGAARPSVADHYGLRNVLARFASGVTITTTRRADGEPVGMTASSFTSLSLEPPLVLVCVATSALSFPYFADCASFGISILAKDQADVALRYATAGALKFTDEDHFNGAASGVPLIRGALAHIECVRHEAMPGGDHIILIGRVVHSGYAKDEPLLTFDRKLGGFASQVGQHDRPATIGGRNGHRQPDADAASR